MFTSNSVKVNLAAKWLNVFRKQNFKTLSNPVTGKNKQTNKVKKGGGNHLEKYGSH